MSAQKPTTQIDVAAPQDRSTRDVAGISLAAVIGGTLLSIADASPHVYRALIAAPVASNWAVATQDIAFGRRPALPAEDVEYAPFSVETAAA